MGADQLQTWEVVLRSPVAVSLLLLGAVLALGAMHLAWVRGIQRENRELNGWIREHLEGEAGIARVLSDLRPLLDLIHASADPSRAKVGDRGPAGLPGLAGASAVARPPSRSAAARDTRAAQVGDVDA